MPAERFTKKANTTAKKRQWSHVYDSAKQRGQPAGSAIRQANAAVKSGAAGSGRKKGHK